LIFKIGVDLKAAAKFFAQKFATGASVTKSPPGSPCTEEIVIQGDVAYDVEELIEEVGGKKGGVLAGIDIDSVEVVEGKK
jgi:density-regulated protein